MKLDIVANSKNDEFYTPEYAITPLLKYLPKRSRVWCPFDTSESNYVKLLKNSGHIVTATHLESGGDFFALGDNKTDYDIIVSNPPYSLKNEVFARLFHLDKPFAMLVGVVGLFESQKRFNLFKDHDFEIMYLNKRVAFFQSFTDQKPVINPPFSSVYITRRLLPDRIVFEEIQK